MVFKSMTTLIADAGATKTDWVKLTVGQESKIISDTFQSVGISPVTHDPDFIVHVMDTVADSIGREFDAIRFFGTGIGSAQRSEKIIRCLADVFHCHDIKAESDMAGAAIAILGNAPGIACIMGTGSNSCHFDGKAIDRINPSLGFLLDDEGGGVAFGKRLLSDVFKRIAPEDIIDDFQNRYSLSVNDVVEHLYRNQSPNRWIAGFMPFITEHIDHPYVSRLADSQISRFIEREFCTYPRIQLIEEGVGFVGSVADIFSDRIQSEFDKRGWKTRGFTAKPLAGLINNILY